MEWRISDDGRRMIGIQHETAKAEFRLEEPSEPVEEPEEFWSVTEPTKLDAEHPLGVNIVPERPERTPERAEEAARLLHNAAWQASRECGVSTNQMIKAVRRIEKSRQRTRVRKRRVRLAWADMLMGGE